MEDFTLLPFHSYPHPKHTHKVASLSGEVCEEALYYADKTQISQVQESSAVSTFQTGTVKVSQEGITVSELCFPVLCCVPLWQCTLHLLVLTPRSYIIFSLSQSCLKCSAF